MDQYQHTNEKSSLLKAISRYDWTIYRDPGWALIRTIIQSPSNAY